MPKVSIGVPIYNQEKLLIRCLESLVSQSLADIEIILVNDGSTDSSLQICREYAKKDKRIVVIDKKNEGLASARQAALEASTGEFFAACDSDDWVELDMYEELYNKARQEQVDLVLCNYFENYADGRAREVIFRPTSLNNEDVLIGVLTQKFPHSMWTKLVRMEVFRKYNLSWIKGINLSEDAVMSIQIARHPVSYAYLEKTLYHYWKDSMSSSYTSKISQKSYEELISANIFISQLFPEERYNSILFFRQVDLASIGLKVVDLNVDVYREILKKTELRNIKCVKVREFFEYRNFPSKFIAVFLTKFLGVKFGKMCVNMMYKIT